MDSKVDMALMKLCKNNSIDNWKFINDTCGWCCVMICNEENMFEELLS